MKIQDALNGRENNFTLLRFLAAFAVLYGHSYDLSQGKSGSDPITQVLIYPYWGGSLPSLAVTFFFVSSGFLVGASYIQRNNLIAFAEARVLRIMPALLVAVLFCIFIIGSFTTALPLSEYYSSPSVWGYFKHNSILVTGIQYDLPGVFLTNPYPSSVNGSLWTLPIEVYMYFWVAVLGSLSLLKGVQVFNLFFLLVCLLYAQPSENSFFIAHRIPNAQLACSFLLGTFFYVNRKEVPLSFMPLVMLGILVFLSSAYSFVQFVKLVFLAFLVLILALHPKLQLPSIERFGDISYGLYIYAFPVQQAIAHMIPDVRPVPMLILATMITVPLAFLSWKFIEKPALKMKGKLFCRPVWQSINSKKGR